MFIPISSRRGSGGAAATHTRGITIDEFTGQSGAAVQAEIDRLAAKCRAAE